MLSRPKTLATVVIAGLCAIATAAIAIPAISAPRKVSGNASALSLAQKAFNLAKTADRRSKLALAKAKPGATGATGPQGPAGTNGTNGVNGKDGTNGSNSTVPGPPGSTLKIQQAAAGPLASASSPNVQTFAFTADAGRSYLAAVSMTVTPPTNTCTGAGMRVEAFLDVQDMPHRFGVIELGKGGGATTFAPPVPAYVMSQNSSTPHSVKITAIDDCADSAHGSVTNMRFEAVEFAPAP